MFNTVATYFIKPSCCRNDAISSSSHSRRSEEEQISAASRDKKSMRLLASLFSCPEFKKKWDDIESTGTNLSVRAISEKACKDSGMANAAISYENPKNIDIYYNGEQSDLMCKKMIIFETINAGKARKYRKLDKMAVNGSLDKNTYAAKFEKHEWKVAREANEVCKVCLGTSAFSERIVNDLKHNLAYQLDSGHTQLYHDQYDKLARQRSAQAQNF